MLRFDSYWMQYIALSPFRVCFCCDILDSFSIISLIVPDFITLVSAL